MTSYSQARFKYKPVNQINQKPVFYLQKAGKLRSSQRFFSFFFFYFLLCNFQSSYYLLSLSFSSIRQHPLTTINQIKICYKSLDSRSTLYIDDPIIPFGKNKRRKYLTILIFKLKPFIIHSLNFIFIRSIFNDGWKLSTINSISKSDNEFRLSYFFLFLQCCRKP